MSRSGLFIELSSDVRIITYGTIRLRGSRRKTESMRVRTANRFQINRGYTVLWAQPCPLKTDVSSITLLFLLCVVGQIFWRKGTLHFPTNRKEAVSD